MLVLPAFLLLPGEARAEGVSGRIGFDLAVGVDSNPYLRPADGRTAAFTEMELAAGLGADLGLRGRWFLDASGRTRIHEDSASHADRSEARIRFGLTVAPSPVLDRRLLLTFGGERSGTRGTFVDRSSGEIWTTPLRRNRDTDERGSIAIPDRFDADTHGLFAEARYRAGGRLTVQGSVRWDRVDYVEDYPSTAGIVRLDHRRFRVEPGLTYRLSGNAALDFAVTYTDLEFREGSAGDNDRRDRYSRVRLSARLAPATGWNLGVGVSSGGRDDIAGVDRDFDTRTAFVSVKRNFGSRSWLNLVASLGTRSDDRPALADLPNGELTSGDVRRIAARFDIDVGRSTGLFAEGGLRTSDSHDSMLAYRNSWVVAGLHFGN